jgi:hypothetical protein
LGNLKTNCNEPLKIDENTLCNLIFDYVSFSKLLEQKIKIIKKKLKLTSSSMPGRMSTE